MFLRRLILLLPFVISFLPAIAQAEDELTNEEIRGAIQLALPLIEKGATGHVEQRACFSCHHQTMPILALTLARAKGFSIDDEVLRDQVEYTERNVSEAADSYRKGSGQGGGVTTAAYALWAFELGGHKADETTDAVTDYLIKSDEKRGFWVGTSARPPSEGSSFSATYFTVRGLQTFSSPAQRDRVSARVKSAREWLVRTPAETTEDRVFRLLALKRADAPEESIREAAGQLLANQREDGGWSQTANLSSDAYATGSVLFALVEAGNVAPEDSAYQKGVHFLLKTQEADGSWHVKSRSKPFQTYFESGFPHGKDQFISMSASSWATAALLLAIK